MIKHSGADREEDVDRAVLVPPEGQKQATIPFEFTVPRIGPLSYSGKLFSIVWELSANVDLPFAIDETDTKVITVVPRIWSSERDAELEDDEEWDEEPDAGNEE
jgi:sporulation-control protein spo0M